MSMAEEFGAPLFAVDARYDRDCASDGRSRYGVYLRQGLAQLGDDEGWLLGDPGWAMFCWDRATVPVMSPPYLAWFEPIETVALSRGDEGDVVAELAVKTCPTRVPPGWGTWERDRHGHLNPPTRVRRPVLLTRASLVVAVPASALPKAPGGERASCPDVDRAKASVDALARLLIEAVTPALSAVRTTADGAKR